MPTEPLMAIGCLSTGWQLSRSQRFAFADFQEHDGTLHPSKRLLIFHCKTPNLCRSYFQDTPIVRVLSEQCQNAKEFGDFRIRKYPDFYIALAALRPLKWPTTHNWLHRHGHSYFTMWWLCTKTHKQKLLGACFLFLNFPTPESSLLSLVHAMERNAVW